MSDWHECLFHNLQRMEVPNHPMAASPEQELGEPHVVWSQTGQSGENAGGYLATSVQVSLDFRAKELMAARDLKDKVIAELNRVGLLLGIGGQTAIYDDETRTNRIVVDVSLTPFPPPAACPEIHPDDRRSFSDSFGPSFG